MTEEVAFTPRRSRRASIPVKRFQVSLSPTRRRKCQSTGVKRERSTSQTSRASVQKKQTRSHLKKDIKAGRKNQKAINDAEEKLTQTVKKEIKLKEPSSVKKLTFPVIPRKQKPHKRVSAIAHALDLILSTSSSESSEESETSSEIRISRPKRKYTKRTTRSKPGTKSVSKKPAQPRGRRRIIDKSLVAELIAGFLDDDAEDENPSVFDFDLNNTHIFAEKWMLLEKINNVPHSSPVYRVVSDDGVYGDLRCYAKKAVPTMYMEVLCLDKMEKFNKSHMFLKICEAQIIKTKKEGSMSYLVTYHRTGPSLKDIMDTNGTLDISSGTKIAIQIFEIIENLTKAKFLMTEISTSFFKFDSYSLRLFLSDATKVVSNFERATFSKGFPAPKWGGALIYAPYNYHKNKEQPLSEGDLVESVFYFCLDMIGMLSWKDMVEKEIVAIKKKWATANVNEMMAELPNALVTCWLTIRRGQLVDVCRSHTMNNGTVLIHQFRDKGLKKKPVPTGAMIEFSIIYEGLRLFGASGRNNLSLLPSCTQQKLLNQDKAALILCAMRLKMERDAVLLEIQALEKRLNSMEIHEKQMKAEVERNEKFIQKYVYDAKEEKEEKEVLNEDVEVATEQQESTGEQTETTMDILNDSRSSNVSQF